MTHFHLDISSYCEKLKNPSILQPVHVEKIPCKAIKLFILGALLSANLSVLMCLFHLLSLHLHMLDWNLFDKGVILYLFQVLLLITCFLVSYLLLSNRLLVKFLGGGAFCT